MTSLRLGMGVSILAIAVAMAGCAAEMADPIDPTGTSQDELSRICPAIAILCAPGYVPKRLPNCNQICVPDNGAECTTDADCGPIYCITSPCDQPVCRGRQCVLDSTPEPSGGEPCGDVRCGANSYCCNASCGICAPDGYACIQIACAPR